MINIDADQRNADWAKSCWDLQYKNEEELKKALGSKYEHFKTLPVYQARPWAIHNVLKRSSKKE